MNSDCTPFEYWYMNRIDLSNYYKQNKERRIIHCEICRYDIAENNVFEHTVGKRHKYNQLLVGIAQSRSTNTDLDFIVLAIDKLQCRYCKFVIINSEREDLVINHVKDRRHVILREAQLNTFDATGRGGNILEPLDSLISRIRYCKKHMYKSFENIEMERTLLVEETKPITKEPMETSDNVRKEDLQYSILSKDYEEQRGETLPKFITTKKGGTCEICGIQMPMTVYNVIQHIDGKKHKQTIIQREELALQLRQIVEAINNFGKKNTAQCSTDAEEEVQPKKLLVCDSTTEIWIIPNKTQLEINDGEHRDTVAKSPKSPSDFINVGESDSAIKRVCLSPTNFGGQVSCDDSKARVNNAPKSEILGESTQCVSTDDSLGHAGDVGNQLSSEIRNEDVSENSSIKEHVDVEEYEAKIQESTSSAENAAYMCAMCGTKVPNNERNIEEHNNGKKHRTNLSAKIAEENGKHQSTQNQDRIGAIGNDNSSEIGDQSLPGNSLITEHVIAKEHGGKIQTPVNGANDTTCTCKLCGVPLSNGEENREMHNNGKKHKKNLLLMKIASKNASYLKNVGSSGHIICKKNSYFCHVCSKTLQKSCSLLEHIKSKDHIQNEKMFQPVS